MTGNSLAVHTGVAATPEPQGPHADGGVYAVAVRLLAEHGANDLTDGELNRCLVGVNPAVVRRLKDARDAGVLTMTDVAHSVSATAPCLQLLDQRQRDYVNDALLNWDNTDDGEMVGFWIAECGLTQEQADEAIRLRPRAAVDAAYLPLPNL